MSKNRDRLARNKQKVVSFVGNIISGAVDNLPEKRVAFDDFASVLSDSQLPNTEQLTEVLRKMALFRDQAQRIDWCYSNDLGDGSRALVRDARRVDDSRVVSWEEDGDKYAMQIVNEVRGASLLLDSYVPTISLSIRKQVEKELGFLLHKIFADKRDLGFMRYEVEKYNSILLHVLEKAGMADAENALLFAKEIGNLHDEHLHMVTLTQTEETAVMEAEVMLNGLTEEQAEEYRTIAGYIGDAVTVRGKEFTWFNSLPEYKKRMIASVAGLIAEGKKVLPTQLLKELNGLRNAYQKITAVVEGGEPLVLSEAIHCGTPASKHKDKRLAQQITEENLRQLRTFVDEDDEINIHILNTPTPLRSVLADVSENFIFARLEAAQSDKSSLDEKQRAGITFAVSPMNKFRHFGIGRDDKRYELFLNDIASKLPSDKFSAINTYLIHRSNFITKLFGITSRLKKAALKELAELEPVHLQQDLNNAIKLRGLLNTSPLLFYFSGENLSALTSQAMHALTNSVKYRKDGLQQYSVKAPVIVDCCKSGKDRTGYVEVRNSHQVVCDHLGIDPQSDRGKVILRKLVCGGHTQQIAGMQGGTVGCYGIKATISHQQKPFIGGILSQRSADFNNKIKGIKGGIVMFEVAAFDGEVASWQPADKKGRASSTISAVAQRKKRHLHAEERTRARLTTSIP